MMLGRPATWDDVEKAAREALELRFERNRYRECAKELLAAVRALESFYFQGGALSSIELLKITEPAIARARWLDDVTRTERGEV